MIENLILQFGALGIVAYVVYDQKKTTNALIKQNIIALNKVSACLEMKKK